MSQADDNKNGRKLLYQTLNLVFVVMASFGVFLVVYGLGKDWWNWQFYQLDRAIALISVYTTLTGALGFCVAIYLPPNPRKALAVTKCIAVPIIGGLVLVALGSAIWRGGNVSEFILRGVAIIVLAGSLIRTLVRDL